MSDAWLFSFGWLVTVLIAFCALGVALSSASVFLLRRFFFGSEYVGFLVYCLLFFPAVALHELSHALFAMLLGAGVSKIYLLPRRVCVGSGQPPRVDPPQIQLARKVDFVRHSLIGAAPVIIGTVAVALLSLLGLDYRAPSYYFTGLDQVVVAVSGFLRQLDLRSTSTLVILYLIYAVGNVMLPSPSDRAEWPRTLAFLMTVAWLMCYFGIRSPVSVSYVTSRWWLQNINYLILTFAFLAIVDLIFVVPLGLLWLLLSRLRASRPEDAE